MTSALSARRRALFLLFFLPGFGLASWATRTPDIRGELGASTAEMGLVLFGLSGGSMLGVSVAGPLVSRFGVRPIVRVGMLSIAVSLVTIGAGVVAGSALLVACGLALFGVGIGAGELAMNVECSGLEALLKKSILPAMHGCFSLGTVLGSLAGGAATALRIPLLLHLTIVAAFTVTSVVLVSRRLTAAPERSRKSSEENAAGFSSLLRDPVMILIAVVVLGVAMGEGVGNDWIALVMVDGFGTSAFGGSAFYAVFAVAVTVARFAGGALVTRLGHIRVLVAGAASAALGMLLIAVVDSLAVAVAAVLLWGLGVALGFPVAISIAGSSNSRPAMRVAMAATVGNFAFLIGPPLLGFVGQATELRLAVLVPCALVAIGGVCAWWIRVPTSEPEEGVES